MIKLNESKINDLVFEGVDHTDYPDYCDVHVVRASYNDIEMTEEQIEVLNDHHSSFIYEEFMETLF